MRFATYVMLMFFLSVGLYLAGFRAEGTSALEKLFSQQQSYTGGSNFVSYDKTMSSLTGSGLAKPDSTVSQILPTIGTALVVGGILALSGFAAIYILAAVMLVVFLNAFVFPTSYLLTPEIMDGGIGATFSLPLKVFFNILTILAILSFVRGGT